MPEGNVGPAQASERTSTVDVYAPARLFTMNWSRTAHFRSVAAVTKAWREAAYVEAKNSRVPVYVSVVVEARPVQRAGRLADPGAHMPVVKACIDGLVDAGILPDDDGRYVGPITLHPPVRGPNGLRLVLVGTLADPGRP